MSSNNPITISIPECLRPKPQPPSAFELGVVEQLRGLAEMLESGAVHVQHFSLTLVEDRQKMEIEVE